MEIIVTDPPLYCSLSDHSSKSTEQVQPPASEDAFVGNQCSYSLGQVPSLAGSCIPSLCHAGNFELKNLPTATDEQRLSAPLLEKHGSAEGLPLLKQIPSSAVNRTYPHPCLAKHPWRLQRITTPLLTPHTPPR